MPIDNQLLKALGLGGATIGGVAAIHGAGLGSVLEPLDYPRRALMNLVRSPMRTLETGDPMHLLGALPGAAGAALGGLVGGPLGVLAGSALGGSLQGAGELTGMPEFQAPQVSDITGTEDFLPNFLVGTLTDPLTYAGLGASFGAGKKALTPLGGALKEAAPVAKAAETAAIPVAKHAPPIKFTPEEYPEHAENVLRALNDPSMQMTEQSASELISGLERLNMEPEEKELFGRAQQFLRDSGKVPVAKPIAPTFYSRLEEAINQLPDSIKAESVINKLKKAGVTDEELEATGILEEVASYGKNKVTKESLLAHFGENKIVIDEKWRGDKLVDNPDVDRWHDLRGTSFKTPAMEQEIKYIEQKLANNQEFQNERRFWELDDQLATYGDLPQDLRIEHDMLEEVIGPGMSNPRHADYQTPGGKNYFELTMKVPARTDVTKMNVQEIAKGPLSRPERLRYEDLISQEQDRYGVMLESQHRELADLRKRLGETGEGASIQEIDNPNGPGGKSFQILDYNNKPMFNDAVFPTREQATEYMLSKHQGKNYYHQSHWGDEPNILVHVRGNERVGPAGERILHIEEMQSDWHQTGREIGYTPKDNEQNFAKAQVRMMDARNDFAFFRSKNFSDESGRLTKGDRVLSAADRDEYQRLKKELAEAEEGWENARKEGAMRGVPDAPFKENWHELAMKRLIRKAAEEGYDVITINPGEQINKVLGSDPGSLGGQRKFYGSPGTGPVPEGFHIEGSPENKAAAKALRAELEGRGVEQGSLEWHTAFADLGDKAVKHIPAEKGTLPNWLNKYAKQFGVKVEPGEIRIPGPTQHEVPSWTRAIDQITYGPDQQEAIRQLELYDNFERVSDILRKHGIEPPFEESGQYLPVSKLQISPKMREQVMTRGQPLLQMGLPLAGGGSALMAALIGENQA